MASGWLLLKPGNDGPNNPHPPWYSNTSAVEPGYAFGQFTFGLDSDPVTLYRFVDDEFSTTPIPMPADPSDTLITFTSVSLTVILGANLLRYFCNSRISLNNGSAHTSWALGSEFPSSPQTIVNAPSGDNFVKSVNIDGSQELQLTCSYPETRYINEIGIRESFGFEIHPWLWVTEGSSTFTPASFTPTEFQPVFDQSMVTAVWFWESLPQIEVFPLRLNQRTDGLGFQGHSRQNQQSNSSHGESDGSGTRVKGYNTYG